jgi:hypothetical protein
MNAYRDQVTLQEIDRTAGLAKGSAFRAFKRLVADLAEGIDYQVLDHQQARETIAELRLQGRIYASSVNVIVLSKPAAARIQSAATEASSTSR